MFRAANRRCEQVLLTPAEREVGRGLRAAEVRGKVPYATPHSTRHSMALYMLIVLNRLMESRYGLSAAGRRDFALLFGDPWFLVKTLLGHADVETTKHHYLAPVTHLHLSRSWPRPGRTARARPGTWTASSPGSPGRRRASRTSTRWPAPVERPRAPGGAPAW